MGFLLLLLLPMLLLLCRSSVSYPQQRSAGYSSPAGCHGEVFPAWSGFASECEGGSCSGGSECLPFTSYFLLEIRYRNQLHFFWLSKLRSAEMDSSPTSRRKSWRRSGEPQLSSLIPADATRSWTDLLFLFFLFPFFPPLLIYQRRRLQLPQCCTK